jgi:hypothetical protein
LASASWAALSRTVLLRAGFAVVGYDVDAACRQNFSSLGGQVAANGSEILRKL